MSDLRVKLILFLLFFLITSIPIYAQPERRFSRFYPGDDPCAFRDVYNCADDGFVMAGEFLSPPHRNSDARLVRVDSNGDQLWASTLTDNMQEMCFSVVEADDGDFVAVGGAWTNGGHYCMAARADAEGNRVWDHLYFEGLLFAVIELKGGNFLCCGTQDLGDSDIGILLTLDAEGDTVCCWRYDDPANLYFRALIETEIGVAALGYEYREDSYIMVVDDEGEIVWDRVLPGDGRYEAQTPNLVRSLDRGIVISNRILQEDLLYAALTKLSINGDFIWRRMFEWNELALSNSNFKRTGLARLYDGGFVLTSYLYEIEERQYLPVAFRTDAQGEEQWRQVYDEGGAFFAVVTDRRERIVAAGYANMPDMEENRKGGWLIQLEPERTAPRFTNVSPLGNDPDRQAEENISSRHEFLRILVEDEVTFMVDAWDPRDRELTYSWFDENQNLLDQDSTVVVVFDELGEKQVRCVVSNGEEEAVALWDVTVLEMIITRHTPIEDELWINRGFWVDFEIEAESYSDEFDFEFQWDVSYDEVENRVIGNSADLSYNFPRATDYQLRGRAIWGESFEDHIWSVQASSTLLGFEPEIIELIVPIDSLVRFELIPREPNSPNLTYQFLVDDDIVGDSSVAEISFQEAGFHVVRGRFFDGIEADSVRWVITATIPNAVDIESRMPKEFGFSSVLPNPFNDRTIINFHIPRITEARIDILDVNGRIIKLLSNQRYTEGDFQVKWIAGGIPGGIYFCRLSIENQSAITKITHLK